MVVMKELAYYFAYSMSQSQEERVTSGQARGGGASSTEASAIKF